MFCTQMSQILVQNACAQASVKTSSSAIQICEVPALPAQFAPHSPTPGTSSLAIAVLFTKEQSPLPGKFGICYSSPSSCNLELLATWGSSHLNVNERGHCCRSMVDYSSNRAHSGRRSITWWRLSCYTKIQAHRTVTISGPRGTFATLPPSGSCDLT